MARAGLDSAAVLDAAAALADEHGLQRLTLAELARTLGVRPPSLYEHVGGLDDLRGRLAIRTLTQLRDALARATVGRARGDALRSLADAYRRFAHAHPGGYAAIQRAPAAIDTARIATDTARIAAATDIVDLIAAVLAGYGLAGDDAIHGVRIVRSALHGFVAIELDGGFGLPLDREISWSRLIAMLDRGLGG